ncbi:MAG: hypothetical protein QOF11_1474 [Chloroflexota bacterium]|jgi:hypothetical protein|nr:hypothetical protein [Chloroflexota bacterium]
MAHLEERRADPPAVGRARLGGWLADTRMAQLADAVQQRPDSLGTLLVILVTTALYLLTSSPERQELDYFVRLADAFVHGRIYLTEAPSWLNELIPKDGVWYVAYPPMPAFLLVPFVAIFGPGFDQQVASCLFGGIAVGLAWLVFGRFALSGRVRLGLTVAFGFGTVLWYVAEVGSVWYISHVVAVMFSMAALLLALERRWPLLVGLLLGCAAISRLPVGLTAPFFLAMIVGLGWPPRLPPPGQRSAAIRAGLAFLVGIGIPTAVYLLYNLARWGTIVDQSYVLIPGVLEDPIYAKHGILALEYIPRHIHAIFLRSWNYVDEPPFFQPSWWGLSLFLTTPLFLWLAKARLRDPRVAWAAIGTALALVPIVTHGNVGLTQFGYRFSLDVQPLLFVILATVFERGMSRWAWAAVAASVAICAYGLWAISIGFVDF